MREMQGFLIRTFIWILAAVGLVEYLLQAAVSRFVQPVVSVYFFPGAEGGLSLGGVEAAAVLVLAFFLLLLWGFSQLFPAPVSTMLLWLTGELEGLIKTFLPANAGILQMDGGHRTLLVLYLLAQLVVILLPFAVAAVVYARIVMREFAKLQREREEERRDYDRRRNLMLSDIAHDLRTPITTVAGYAAALSDGVAEPEREKEYLDAIRAKSARMDELIVLLFDYVKLDSDGFSLNRKPLDLCELLRENAALVYSDAEERGMDLTVEIPETALTVEADRLQLSRVVTNLLTNAIRHNPEGTQLGLFLLREEERLVAAVADTGARIGEELAEHLFEPFSRGDKSRSGEGSGLGLSIAKKVVEMHGWSLALVQQPALRGIGLERYAKAFVIVIPLA